MSGESQLHLNLSHKVKFYFFTINTIVKYDIYSIKLNSGFQPFFEPRNNLYIKHLSTGFLLNWRIQSDGISEHFIAILLLVI